MCTVDRKTYVHSDGRREKSETHHRCSRAVATGVKLCGNVQRRSFEATRVVEARPSSSANESHSPPPSVPSPIRKTFDASSRLDRGVSKRSSNSSSLHRRSGVTAGSPVSVPSSASSPPISEVKPSSRKSTSRSPSIAGSASPVPERKRMPYPPPQAPVPPSPPPEPARVVLDDGTAVYDQVPSMAIPRAANNERVRSERRSSISSTTAEVDDVPVRRKPTRASRPSVTFGEEVKYPSETEQATSRAGRSSRTSRNGEGSSSGKCRESQGAETVRPDPRRELREEQRQRRAQRQEDSRQSRTERDRPAESERRQRTSREEERARVREDSDERRRQHREEAAAALEGVDPFIAEQREAEYAQMLRERQMARQRRESQRQYDLAIITNQPYQRGRDYYSARTYTGDGHGYYGPPSPLSPRSPGLPMLPVYSTRRDSASFQERGDSVIAREQIRRAHEQMSDAFGSMTFDEMCAHGDDDDLLSEDQEERERRERRASRRASRDERRRRRAEEMYWI